MMAVPGVLGILVVMLIAGVVLGALVILVAALVRSGRAGRIVAGVFAGVLTAVVLLGGLAAGFRALTVVRARRVRSYATPSETVGAFPPKTTVMSASGTEAVPAIWHEGIEREMAAEVYPSVESAVGALAVQAGPLIETALGDETRPGQVLIYQTPENSGIVQAFRHRLRERQGLDAEIVQAMDSDAGSAGGESDISEHVLVFKLRVENERFHNVTGNDAETRQRTGVLDLTVKGPAGTADARARYHEKPWLVDFPQFQSRHRDHSYVLARSTGPATARSEADRQALSQACRRVAQILDEIRARTPDRFLHGSFHVNPADLEQYGMIVDRFSQRFYGTAGPIWRSAVLVDVSRDRLEPLIQSRMAVMRVERSMWAGVLLRLLGLGVLITVVYVFLDTATRGYYTWSLRIAAAGLAIAGVVIVLLWA